MEKFFTINIPPVKWGVLIAMLSLLYVFGLGIVLGGAEDSIVDHFESTAASYFKEKGKMSAAKIKKKARRLKHGAWKYLKRAHYHAGGIGVIALVTIIILSFMMNIPTILKTLASLALGIGSLGYPLSWMIAGLNAPGLGSTHLGKESIAWLAIPSAILLVIGLAAVILFFIYEAFLRKKA